MKIPQHILDRHESVMRKQVKKKRACIRPECGKVFISRDSGHRVCDVCARKEQMGVLAELSIDISAPML